MTESPEHRRTRLPADLSKFSVAELEALRNDVESSMVSIKSQLERAKSDAYTKGVYSDSDWFLRTQHAHRALGTEHQRLNREIGARRKEERRQWSSSFPGAFMAVARKRLDPGLYEAIYAEATQLTQSKTEETP